MIKGLTLTEPWALLVASGAKRIETRNWKTDYEGLVAIHASRAFPGDAIDWCFKEPFYSVLRKAGLMDNAYLHDSTAHRARVKAALPLGAIVAVATLRGCVPTEAFSGRRHWYGTPLTLSDQERAFGDFSPGRWAWILADVRALKEPIPCRGSLGLWAVPSEIEIRLLEVA